MEIQAVIFKNKYYSTAEARKWLKDNNHKPIKRVHKTTNYLRYRLTEPTYKYYITKSAGKKIKLVMGTNKKPNQNKQ